MKDGVAKKILIKVKRDYGLIANEFNATRHYIWPDLNIFENFVKPNMKVLDLGCGNGRLYDMLKHKNIQYLGIDNCDRFIKIAQDKYHDGNSLFRVGDITAYPKTTNNYDAIFLVAAWQHIPSVKIRRQVMDNIFSSLKKNGLLLMTNWNLWQPKYKKHIRKNNIKKIFGQSELDFNDCQFTSWQIKIERYCHAFTLKEIKKLLTLSNLKILKNYQTPNNIITIAQKP
ncbi:class I SAM-dependent methyltransferase [Patescibacteria group bacterium]|nr:class I SAM-dependent methyltransferase [Patescibacteria group bacterium]